MKLRPYQEKAIADCRKEFLSGKQSVLLCAPCGAGKTIIATAILLNAFKKGSRAIFVCHRDALLQQTKAKLESVGIVPGIIAAGYQAPTTENILLASSQTLNFRDTPKVDLIILDECHEIAFWKSTKKLREDNPTAKVIGLTATPYRLSKKESLAKEFDAFVPVSSTEELLEEGFLCKLDYLGVPLAKQSIIDDDSLTTILNTQERNNHTIKTWLENAKGRKTLLFCASVDHSKNLVQAFSEKGISAAHIDHNTNQQQRDRLYGMFRTGTITILSCVNLLTTGFDCPDVGCIIMLRHTKSKSLYAQMVGRGVRPAPDKEDCVVLDFAANTQRHGFYEQMIPRSLDEDDTQQLPGEAPVKQCPECQHLVSAGFRVCPHCSYEFPLKYVEKVEYIMDLERINPENTEQIEFRKFARTAFTRRYNPAYAENKFREKYHKPIRPEWRHGIVFQGKGDFEDNKRRYRDYLQAVAQVKGYTEMWIDQWMRLEFGAA